MAEADTALDTVRLKGLPLKKRLDFYNEAMKLRKEKGWGRRRIAKALGISAVTVGHWLYFGSKPSHPYDRSGSKNPFYDRHHSEETKQKISVKHKGMKMSDDFRKKCSEHSRKLWRTPEFRKRMRERNKGTGNPFYGKHHTKQTKRRLSEMRKGKHISPQTELQNLLKKPEFRKKLIYARAKRPTKPELRLIEIIKEHKLPYRYVGNGDFWIENVNPDFVECNGQKIVLEVFGCYWHSPLFNPRVKPNKTFHGRKQILRKYGWKCAIFWDDELLGENAEAIVLERLKGFE